MDEEDESYEESTASEDELDAGSDSDGEGLNPCNDGTCIWTKLMPILEMMQRVLLGLLKPKRPLQLVSLLSPTKPKPRKRFCSRNESDVGKNLHYLE